MKALFITLFLHTAFFIHGQDRNVTSNIKLSAVLENTSNIKTIRVVKKGEILMDPDCQSCQSLAIYNVLEDENITQTNANTWLVEIAPGEKVKVRMEARCLNKGLALPQVNRLRPTGNIYSNPQSLETQKETWDAVSENLGILYFSVTGESSVNMMEGYQYLLEKAVENLFESIYISLDKTFIDEVKTESEIFQLKEVNAKTDLGVPIKLINMEIKELDTSVDNIHIKIIGNVFVEPQFRGLFGQILASDGFPADH